MLKKQSLAELVSAPTGLSIGGVERDTGIARDTLRVWQRRYGFPKPLRNSRDERIYPPAQVKRLQRIRRLLDQGLRPGKIVPLNEDGLARLEAGLFLTPGQEQHDNVAALIACLQEHEAIAVEKLLGDILATQGLRVFVLATLVPLLKAIGEGWARGELDIFEEHFMSQVLMRFLSAQIANRGVVQFPAPVLLGTLPGEQHGLGLMLTATLLASEDIGSINLGVEIPMDQLVLAAEKTRPRVLGLTFSAAYPYAMVRSHLQELRARLPSTTVIWAGGHAMQRMRKLPRGVVKIKSLDELPLAMLG